MNIPVCQSCKLPLRVWKSPHVGRPGKDGIRFVWKVECSNAKTTCRFGNRRAQADTRDDAIARFIARSSTWPIERRTVERGPRKYNIEPIVYGRCKCGLRIYTEGATGCDDCVKDIHHHVRSGNAAGGERCYA